MEINKQLFEDVLSGKLKGTFVFRNQLTCNSDKLTRNTGGMYTFTHPYCIMDKWSYSPGGIHAFYGNSNLDIIDFIPDTDMKENELTIEIPNDKVVDWDESKKQNKIVFRDKQLTYEDVCKKLFVGKDFYFICGTDSIVKGKASDSDITRFLLDANNAPSKHQLECILAKNKLATVAKYLNGEWVPDKTDLGHFNAWVLFATPDKDYIGYSRITDCAHNSNALFKSPELAQQAVKILGEETIKLALEPLGI